MSVSEAVNIKVYVEGKGEPRCAVTGYFDSYNLSRIQEFAEENKLADYNNIVRIDLYSDQIGSTQRYDIINTCFKHLKFLERLKVIDMYGLINIYNYDGTKRLTKEGIYENVKESKERKIWKFNFSSSFNGTSYLNNLIKDSYRCKQLGAIEWVRLVNNYYLKPMHKVISHIKNDIWNKAYNQESAKSIEITYMIDALDVIKYDAIAFDFINEIEIIINEYSSGYNYNSNLESVINLMSKFDDPWHIFDTIKEHIDDDCYDFMQHEQFKIINIEGIDGENYGGCKEYDGSVTFKSEIFYDPTTTKEEYDKTMNVLYSYTNLGAPVYNYPFYPTPEIIALFMIMYIFVRTYKM